eukprot:TRINITY_DN4518_c0_g9_i1.p1 TRINITY_DN4518_c0_g9~~TRINITY_DN4518_c0_g9_i1.p1  ORF type:complete len:360 (-),score=53.41 TRINITY_DN4518_c0_g9_i1:16-1095(-)
MDPNYSLCLNRFIYTANCFAEGLEVYRQHIAQDTDLTSSSVPKMNSLIESFIARCNDLILGAEAMRSSFTRVDKGMALASADTIAKYKALEDEHKSIRKLFDKLSISTPKLLELKREVEEKIGLYEAVREVKEERKVEKSVDANEKWLEALAEEVVQRGGQVKELVYAGHKKLASSSMNVRTGLSKDVPSYLTGFKVVQEELAELKGQMQLLSEMQEKHSSTNLREDVHKLLEKTERVATDNVQIKEDHAELMHSLHIICKSIYKHIGKRVELLEEDNVQLRNAAYKLAKQYRETETMPSDKELKPTVFNAKKTLGIEPRVNEEVSDWVLKRIKKCMHHFLGFSSVSYTHLTLPTRELV